MRWAAQDIKCSLNLYQRHWTVASWLCTPYFFMSYRLVQLASMFGMNYKLTPSTPNIKMEVLLPQKWSWDEYRHEIKIWFWSFGMYLMSQFISYSWDTWVVWQLTSAQIDVLLSKCYNIFDSHCPTHLSILYFSIP